MWAFVVLVWVGMVATQATALYSGLSGPLNLSWPLAALLSAQFGCLPIIGTVLGLVCALNVWGWGWALSCLVFLPGLAFVGTALMRITAPRAPLIGWPEAGSLASRAESRRSLTRWRG